MKDGYVARLIDWLIDLDARSSELGFSEVPVSTPALVYDDGRWIRSFFLSFFRRWWWWCRFLSFVLSFCFLLDNPTKKKSCNFNPKKKKSCATSIQRKKSLVQLQSNENKVLQLLLVSSLKVLPMRTVKKAF